MNVDQKNVELQNKKKCWLKYLLSNFEIYNNEHIFVDNLKGSIVKYINVRFEF